MPEIIIYRLNNNQLPGYWGEVKIKTNGNIAIGFNMEELAKYPHLINSIIIHEFCHIWAWLKIKNLSHGKYWKGLMKKAGEKPWFVMY